MIDDTEKAAALNTISASRFLGKVSSQTSACTVWEGERWLRVGGQQAGEYLKKQYVFKYVGSHGIHPWVLKELTM